MKSSEFILLVSTQRLIFQNLLELVVAAQNLDVFVPMMMRKNIELQLQAMEMIEVYH